MVQTFAGHKYPSATEKYRQTEIEELKAGVEKYPISANDMDEGATFDPESDIFIIPEVVIPSRKYSGTDTYPEPESTTVTPPVELPAFWKGFKKAADIAKELPYVGDVHTLHQISQSNRLSNHKNPVSLAFGNKIPGSGTLNGIASSLVLDNFSKDLEERKFFGQLNKLNTIADYNEFASEVNMHNSGRNYSDPKTLIIIYTDEKVQRGEMFWSIHNLNPTFYARYREDFEFELEYGGWKPKYAIFGIKEEFTGNMFPIRGVIEINYND